MSKYHINKQGNPGICKAEIDCPFGDLETAHYASKNAARAAYEKSAGSIFKRAYPKINWPALSADKKLTIHAGMMRTLYRSGEPERIYWDAVWDNTKAGKLWLERKGMTGDHEVIVRTRKAQEVALNLPTPEQPEVLKINAETNFSKVQDMKQLGLPLAKGTTLDVTKRELVYLSAVWISNLSPEEIDAVSFMTSNGTSVMRQHLGGQEPAIWGYDQYPEKWLDRQYEYFLSAMDKAPVIDEAIILYRGTANEYIDLNVQLPRSTSADSTTAESFIRNLHLNSAVIWEIRTNKIASAMCMSAWGATEMEILAPLGDYEKLYEYSQEYESGRKEITFPIAIVQTEKIF
jgi:hypothetical protein